MDNVPSCRSVFDSPRSSETTVQDQFVSIAPMIKFNLLLSLAVVVVTPHNAGSAPAGRIVVDLGATNLDQSIYPSIDANRMLRGNDESRDAVDEERAPTSGMWSMFAPRLDEEPAIFLAMKWKKRKRKFYDGSKPDHIFKFLKENKVGIDQLTRVVNEGNGEFKIDDLTITRRMVSAYQAYIQRPKLNKLFHKKKFNPEDKEHQKMFLLDFMFQHVPPDKAQNLLTSRKVENFGGLMELYKALCFLDSKFRAIEKQKKLTGTTELFEAMKILKVDPNEFEATINLGIPIYFDDTKEITSDFVQDYRTYLNSLKT